MEHQFLHRCNSATGLASKCELTPNEHFMYIKFAKNIVNVHEPYYIFDL